MILTKINQEITLLEGFTPRKYKGLIIESYFDYENLSINSVIKEWDNEIKEVINPTEEIAQLAVMKVLNITLNENTLAFENIDNNIVLTFKNWLKNLILNYILNQVNPFTNQRYFNINNIEIEVY